MNSQTLWKNDIGTASDVNGSTLSDGVTDNSSNMPVVPKIPVMRKNPPSTSLATKKRKAASISVRARVQTKMANTQLHTSLNCSKTNFVPETQIDISVIPDSQVQPLKQKKGKGRKSKITNVDRPASDHQTNKNEQNPPIKSQINEMLHVYEVDQLQRH